MSRLQIGVLVLRITFWVTLFQNVPLGEYTTKMIWLAVLVEVNNILQIWVNRMRRARA